MPHPRYDDYYLVADNPPRIKSIDREIEQPSRWGGSFRRRIPGRLLVPNPRGQVWLCANGVRWSATVAVIAREAFGDTQ